MSAATANRRTVRLNVSGTKYEVECSLIELYPNTMLARFISERWRQSQNPDQEEIFIGRNGSRFEYILDYMRDRKVHLPATISKESFLQELHYYGFEDVPSDAIVIVYAGYEAAQHMARYQEAHEKKIVELRESEILIKETMGYEIVSIECYKKFSLYGRLKINFNLDERGYENFFKFDFDEQVFNETLERYGLQYASHQDCRQDGFYFSIVLARASSAAYTLRSI